MNQPIAIGTKYLSSGKHPKECTVVDIHTTTNQKGEVVKIRYLTEHIVLGQAILEYDVLGATIKIGIDKLKNHLQKTL